VLTVGRIRGKPYTRAIAQGKTTSPRRGNPSTMFLMMGLMLPFFFFAMFERDDQSAEKILRNILRARWFFPVRRIHRTDNLYQYLGTEGKVIANENQTAKAAGKTPTANRPAGQRRQGRA
jgi:hypothetical protein